MHVDTKKLAEKILELHKNKSLFPLDSGKDLFVYFPNNTECPNNLQSSLISWVYNSLITEKEKLICILKGDCEIFVFTNHKLYFFKEKRGVANPNPVYEKKEEINYSTIREIKHGLNCDCLHINAEKKKLIIDSSIILMGTLREFLEFATGLEAKGMPEAIRKRSDDEAMGREVMSTEMYDDGREKFTLELEYEYGAVEVRGASGNLVSTYYRVYEVNCASYPVISEEQACALCEQKYESTEKIEDYIEDYIRETVSGRLRRLFGYDVGISFNERSQRATVIVSDGRLPPGEVFKLEKSQEAYINLYVDIGSTNTKFFVAKCDKDGRNEVLDIGNHEIVPTECFCQERVIPYDKMKAYTSTEPDFILELCAAAIRLVQSVQREKKAYVVDVMWSFPKILNELESNFDFEQISLEVTRTLRTEEYGLGGVFRLVEESSALYRMFYKQIITILQKVRAEEERNDARQKQINEQNQKEKHRAAEAKKYDKEHSFKKWVRKGSFGLFCKNPHGSPKVAGLEEFTPEEFWKKFRDTGANLDEPFLMLLLDAGGSTLDFSLLKGEDVLDSGSFKAGGRDVTMCLVNKEAYNFDDAELEKFDKTDRIVRTSTESLYEKWMGYTKTVYENALTAIAEKVKQVKQEKADRVCVICSGLAMKNFYLRECIRHILELPSQQLLFFSPDIVNQLQCSNDKRHFPDSLKDFCVIVQGHDAEGREASPSYDIAGGLYFEHSTLKA